jgi:hypothetical protein
LVPEILGAPFPVGDWLFLPDPLLYMLNLAFESMAALTNDELAQRFSSYSSDMLLIFLSSFSA